MPASTNLLGIGYRHIRGGEEDFDRASKKIRKSGKDAAEGVSAAERETKSLDTRWRAIKGAAGVAVAGVTAVGVAVAATTALIIAAILPAARFEAGLIGVGKTANLEGAALEHLGDSIDALSRKIPASTEELLGIAQAAGQLGVTGEPAILAFTETIAKLGSASDLAGEEAATALARILTVTGESAESVGTLASVIVSLGNNFAATESQIARHTGEIARATAVYEIGSAQSAALATTLAAFGVQAELSGSAVGRSFRLIESAVKGGGKQLEALSKVARVSGEELRAAYGRSTTEAFGLFLQGLRETIREGGNVAAELKTVKLQGEEILKVLPVLAKEYDTLARAQGLAATETENATALNVESDKALGSLSAQWAVLRNETSSAIRLIGTELVPAAKKIVGEVKEWVSENRPLLTQLGRLGGETLDAVATNVDRTATAVNDLADAFQRLAGGVGAGDIAIVSFNVVLGVLVRDLERAVALIKLTTVDAPLPEDLVGGFRKISEQEELTAARAAVVAWNQTRRDVFAEELERQRAAEDATLQTQIALVDLGDAGLRMGDDVADGADKAQKAVQELLETIDVTASPLAGGAVSLLPAGTTGAQIIPSQLPLREIVIDFGDTSRDALKAVEVSNRNQADRTAEWTAQQIAADERLIEALYNTAGLLSQLSGIFAQVGGKIGGALSQATGLAGTVAGAIPGIRGGGFGAIGGVLDIAGTVYGIVQGILDDRDAREDSLPVYLDPFGRGPRGGSSAIGGAGLEPGAALDIFRELQRAYEGWQAALGGMATDIAALGISVQRDGKEFTLELDGVIHGVFDTMGDAMEAGWQTVLRTGVFEGIGEELQTVLSRISGGTELEALRQLIPTIRQIDRLASGASEHQAAFQQLAVDLELLSAKLRAAGVSTAGVIRLRTEEFNVTARLISQGLESFIPGMDGQVAAYQELVVQAEAYAEAAAVEAARQEELRQGSQAAADETDRLRRVTSGLTDAQGEASDAGTTAEGVIRHLGEAVEGLQEAIDPELIEAAGAALQRSLETDFLGGLIGVVDRFGVEFAGREAAVATLREAEFAREIGQLRIQLDMMAELGRISEAALAGYRSALDAIEAAGIDSAAAARGAGRPSGTRRADRAEIQETFAELVAGLEGAAAAIEAQRREWEEYIAAARRLNALTSEQIATVRELAEAERGLIAARASLDIRGALAQIIGDEDLIRELQLEGQRIRIAGLRMEAEQLHAIGQITTEQWAQIQDLAGQAFAALEVGATRAERRLERIGEKTGFLGIGRELAQLAGNQQAVQRFEEMLARLRIEQLRIEIQLMFEAGTISEQRWRNFNNLADRALDNVGKEMEEIAEIDLASSLSSISSAFTQLGIDAPPEVVEALARAEFELTRIRAIELVLTEGMAERLAAFGLVAADIIALFEGASFPGVGANDNAAAETLAQRAARMRREAEAAKAAGDGADNAADALAGLLDRLVELEREAELGGLDEWAAEMGRINDRWDVFTASLRDAGASLADLGRAEALRTQELEDLAMRQAEAAEEAARREAEAAARLAEERRRELEAFLRPLEALEADLLGGALGGVAPRDALAFARSQFDAARSGGDSAAFAAAARELLQAQAGFGGQGGAYAALQQEILAASRGLRGGLNLPANDEQPFAAAGFAAPVAGGNADLLGSLREQAGDVRSLVAAVAQLTARLDAKATKDEERDERLARLEATADELLGKLNELLARAA